MKLLEKKEGLTAFYCVLFLILATLSMLLKYMFVEYLTEFVITVYLLVEMISKNEKVNRIFSIMFGIFLLYPILSFGYSVIHVFMYSNLTWSLTNILSNLARIVVYLYAVYSLLFRKGEASKILYFVIIGACLILSVIIIILVVIQKFVLISFIMIIIHLMMYLLLTRYAYLYKN